MLLKNTASQLVQLGSLINVSDGARLTSSATVRWCKDGTWAAGGGTLSVEETDQYKYAPTQAETNCTQWAIAVDHASAVQPLVVGGRTMLANVGDVYSVAGTAQAALDVSTAVAAIKAKTDNLPADPAQASTITTQFSGQNTKLDSIISTQSSLLSEINAIETGDVNSIRGSVEAAEKLKRERVSA